MTAHDDAVPRTSGASLSERLGAELAGIDIPKMAFSLAVTAVVAVQGALVYIGFTKTSVEVDEGFFLTVVHNVATGHGYAGAAWHGATGSRPFSTDISTGPTLLAPAAALNALGIETVLAGRLTALLFYVALLAAMWVIGSRVGGRWAGLAATLGPVMLNAFTFDQSPIYAPQSVLGEYTAAAMVAWAIVTSRRRPGAAGVFFGFAVVAKTVSVFLLPAVLVAIVLAHLVVHRGALVRAILRFAAAALVPIIAFEAFKLVVLGGSAYRQLASTYWESTQIPRLADFMVDEKTASLWRSWFMPTPVAILLAAIALALVAGVVAMRLQVWSAAGTSWRAIASDERFVMAASGLTAGAGILVGWSALKYTDPSWLRHPAPGLVIAAGTVAAILAATGSALVRWGGPGCRVGAAALVVTALVLTTTSVRHVDASLRDGRFGYLQAQQELAAIIAASGTQEVQGLWGPLVPLAVIADVPAHSILVEANPDDLLVLDVYPRGQLAELGNQLADVLCRDVIYSGDVIMCWPRPDIADVVAPLDIETETPTPPGTGTGTGTQG